ncbi:acyl-CoA dehydrogenase family protein [Rhodococcus opacus]|uniref:acyl-CoA dehydrogenase family protein n=1 Tax=Rhodococcus opacus TaxID=37919 RepID=UPI001C45D203|nr:acyl-CoA dehydrogenase family protein [Rhodococcus opacus]MBV6760230.1 acyl-CoA dehydrogenase family protein [Rhodococcus opacus]
MSVLPIEQASDQFNADTLLTDAEIRTREAVREFNTSRVAKGAAERWAAGEMATHLIDDLAALGVIGGGVDGYGCSGLGDVSDGLVAAELAKVDFGLSAFFGIQSVLSLRAVAALGSEEQRERWLPGLARCELIGSLGVTEPDHGSDTSSMHTRAQRVPGGYLLSGSKRWVGNASIGSVNVIFAKDPQDRISGFVVEKDAPGFSAVPIEAKVAMRSSWPTDIVLDEVFVPEENRLAASDNPRQTAAVFNAVRPIAAWQALGLSIGAFEATLDYLQNRTQFGRALVEFQLVQEKLATMAVTISSMRLICIQVSRALAAGTMTHVQASAAKLSCARSGRQVVALARDLLGGNGIVADYPVGRHFADMEAVYTYDGTDHIQSLIVGKAITGYQALR